MIRNIKLAALSLPLVLVLTGCGDPEAKQEEQLETATLDEPGLEDTSVTPDEAQSEALTLAAHLSSGELDTAETATTLEDLDRLITANIVEFPEDIRAGLTEDLKSAHAALGAGDTEGLQEAAVSIEKKLSSTDSSSDAN